jgi:hypothetical protein
LMTVISGTLTAAAVASGVGAAIGGGVAAGRAATPQGPPSPPSGGPGPGGPAPGGAAQGPNPSPGAAQQPGIANAVLAQSRPPTPPGSGEGGGSAGSASSSAGSAVADSAGGSSSTSASSDSAGSDGAPATGSGGAPAPTPPVLWNPKTGQVFAWGGSGWQAAGHVSSPGASSLIQQNGGQYGVTHWTGGDAGQTSRGYTGKSLAGHAIWQAGHIVGRTMRLVGMGKA